LSLRYFHVLGSLIKKLNGQAMADPLTNIPNRRLFEPALKAILSRGPTAILMIDLDNFKDVNDQLGHQTGDIVLIEVGKVIQNGIRHGDICARFGGDEFVVILPNADLSAAYKVGQRLLTELNKTVAEVHPNCGASIGIGAVESNEDPAQIIKLADDALYQAKESGGKTIRHLLDSDEK
jgi:diguanylate cyclase (GGDEF)-like protein